MPVDLTFEWYEGEGFAEQYAEELEAIREGFEYEFCELCGKDLDHHIVAPDPLGHAHVHCLDKED